VVTDEDLMLRYRDGSPDAFEELFGRYRQAIWAFFRRRLADKGRAEDLAQETFLAVMKAASRYEPRASFRAYLYGIAFNLLSAERRKAHTRDAAPFGGMSVGVAVPGDPEATLWNVDHWPMTSAPSRVN
jgi:RNA polymerase sigma-70 factor (ECF subfamily)